MVGIQEAVHEIMHFDLMICSDTIQTLNLSMCQTLLRKGEKKKGEDLVNRYMNRSNEHESLSLERYFYKVWCNEKTQKGKKKGYSEPLDYIANRYIQWISIMLEE